MNVINFEKKEKNIAELTVEVTAEEFEKAVNKAYLKMRGRINIPGFRKGKAPRKMIENMYGTGVFYEDALEEIYPEAYAYAVLHEELNVVGQPSLLDVNVNDDKSVTLKYSVSLFPEVTLGEYKGLEAPKPVVRVNKSEIEEEIEKIRKRNARVQAVEREAKTGDTVNIDYEGFLNGTPFNGGKDSGYDLVLGSGYFVPGFEDQLVGVKAGEEKDLDITFPENYAEELAGKAVVFKVKVNEVKESILPELDDEFAKDVSEFDTLDEYKASVKETISARKKAAAENSFNEVIMNKLIDNMQCDIPDAMVEERIDSIIENYNFRLMEQGLNLEQYIQMLGVDMDGFRNMSRDSALREIQEELVLDKVAELEAIEIAPEAVEAEYELLASQYNIEIDEVKKGVSADLVISMLKKRAASEVVYSTAVVEKKKAKKEAEETPAE